MRPFLRIFLMMCSDALLVNLAMVMAACCGSIAERRPPVICKTTYCLHPL